MTIGDRVSTPEGPGTVQWVQASSGYLGVAVDERLNRMEPGYVCSVFHRRELERLTVEPEPDLARLLDGGPGGDF